jgi:N-acetylglutamate synthase
MSNTIVTREFSSADYQAAVELWQRVEGLEIAEGDDSQGVAHFLAHNPGLSRVAVDRDVIVGVALCGHDGRRGHIYHLAVDPAYRRDGLGRRLLRECLGELRKTKVKRVIILVARENERGAEFWKGCGFEAIPDAVAMGIDV